MSHPHVAEGDPRDQRRQGVHRPEGPGHPPRPRQLRDLLRQVSGGAGGLHTKEDVYICRQELLTNYLAGAKSNSKAANKGRT